MFTIVSPESDTILESMRIRNNLNMMIPEWLCAVYCGDEIPMRGVNHLVRVGFANWNGLINECTLNQQGITYLDICTTPAIE